MKGSLVLKKQTWNRKAFILYSANVRHVESPMYISTMALELEICGSRAWKDEGPKQYR